MLDRLINHLPRDRQIMLFSATFPIMVETFRVSFFLSAFFFWSAFSIKNTNAILFRTATCTNLLRSTWWVSWRSVASRSSTRTCRRSRRSTAWTPCSPNCRSISTFSSSPPPSCFVSQEVQPHDCPVFFADRSSSATRLNAWNSWPRRSPNWAIRRTLSTRKCSSSTGTIPRCYQFVFITIRKVMKIALTFQSSHGSSL